MFPYFADHGADCVAGRVADQGVWRSALKSAVVAAGVALACAGLTGCETNVSNADIKPISLGEIREKMESGKDKAILLIDARSARAYGEGRIPGAINMGIDSIVEREPIVDKRLAAYKTLAVYGEDPGSPSAQALTKRLLFVKYDDVRMFMDGISGWKRAGLPVERTGGGGGGTPAGTGAVPGTVPGAVPGAGAVPAASGSGADKPKQ